MPRLCVFRCAATGVSMHKFPNPKKYPERFRIWVKIVGGKLESEADIEYYTKKLICDLHFDAKDKAYNNRLNAFAVPSHYLAGTNMAETQMPCTSSNNILDIQTSAACITITSDVLVKSSTDSTPKQNDNNSSTDLITTPTEIQTHTIVDSDVLQMIIEMDHNYCKGWQNSRKIPKAHKKSSQGGKRAPTLLVEHMKKNRWQMKNLRREVLRLRERNATFKERLSNAKRIRINAVFKTITKTMTTPAKIFTYMQFKQTSKRAGGRRFSLEEKVLSLSLYKKSPKSYSLLRRLFTLPSAKSMKRLLSEIKLKPGINKIIFEKLKSNVNLMSEEDRLCTLIFDEMSLTPQISYEAHNDKLKGFTENNNIADHALVFMVKGIKCNFEQPSSSA